MFLNFYQCINPLPKEGSLVDLDEVLIHVHVAEVGLTSAENHGYARTGPRDLRPPVVHDVLQRAWPDHGEACEDHVSPVWGKRERGVYNKSG